jgi:UDP-glucose 4-epimerase
MILITGGTGYIGSHTFVALMAAGYKAFILDNLSNSSSNVVNRIESITGTKPLFMRGDIRDADLLDRLFSENKFEAVLHFAGLKAVGESVAKPLDYYEQNVGGTVTLLQSMKKASINTIVFSSSATVYGCPPIMPIKEDYEFNPANPYGRSKRMIEDILTDQHVAEPDWKIAILRYFNPVRAHESGFIGEAPHNTPNTLMPYIPQLAAGQRKFVSVFGNDYPTTDGTGVRDYIHVVDLAEGHVAALKFLEKKTGLLTVNLGTGQGHSVLEVLRVFEKVSGRTVPFQIAARRPGDVAQYWADPSMAAKTLGWSARRGLEAMCADAWRWQQNNPGGYAD